MIKAIVVDDEFYNLEEIADLINDTEWMQVVGKYQNPIQVLEDIEDLLPDVAFIDIEMPEIDGLTLAERIQEKKPGILISFITSWNQYAVQAFDLNAIDYIMKPIRIQRFHKMITKIVNEINRKKPSTVQRLQVKCFGRLETTIDEVPVKWKRAKAEEVFAYLLMHHDHYVHKDMIVEHLWPEYELLNALRILQTSICRIRNIFSQISKDVTIDYSGSKYCLSIANDNCDYFEIENALSSFNLHDESTYLAVAKGSKIIRKGFLTEHGYIWSIEKDEDLRKEYTKVLQEIIERYTVEKHLHEAVKYLKELSILVPYDEDINYKLIKMLKGLKKDKEALQHYRWLVEILRDDYDSTPGEGITKLFKYK